MAEELVSSADSIGILENYLEECRNIAIEEIRGFVPQNAVDSGRLYDLMLEYPLRQAKALRPALAIATCRALGGRLAGVSCTAGVLELYHNAFLIHDDVEDGSEMRRHETTLHRTHGVPIAVNVGDGMLALALDPLLDNMRLLGMGKALRILETVGKMARASAEGQAMELAWIRDGAWGLSDAAYYRMIYKKSAWYTFLTPITIGAIVAGCRQPLMSRLRRFAIELGLAFQIHDDVLNLKGDEDRYGKEIGGDLWEGKHTLILIHALRSAGEHERRRAHEVLAKARPSEDVSCLSWHAKVEQLHADGQITDFAVRRLLEAAPTAAAVKTQSDVNFLQELIDRYKSIDYARKAALARADRARRTLSQCDAWLPDSVHRRVLFELVDFVVQRTR